MTVLGTSTRLGCEGTGTTSATRGVPVVGTSRTVLGLGPGSGGRMVYRGLVTVHKTTLPDAKSLRFSELHTSQSTESFR